MLIHLAIIFASSIAIYYLGNAFAEASSRIGDHYRLPKGVKGATLDAISSSLPELLIALFAVLFFGRFDIGVATIAGSAAFNLLIIPALSVLVAPGILKVAKRVIARDGLFYIISLILLLAAVWYAPTWGILLSVIFLGLYAVYIGVFVNDAKKHRETVKSIPTHIPRDIGIAGITALLIAGASYLLVEHAIDFANAIGVHPVLIAFTIIAAATSVPDTVVSMANARKGSGDDAISNALGSNTFDILIGLGIPVLAYVLLIGEPVVHGFMNMEILFGLLAATMIVLYLFARNNSLSKQEGVILLVAYAGFLVYVFFFSL